VQKLLVFKRYLLLTSFLLFFAGSSVSAQYYGMQFAAHDYSLDQRSGLDLTPDGPLSFKENLDLQFYFRFNPGHESYFGYIYRLIIGDQIIDLVHSFVPGNPNNFELIINRKTSKIAFHIPLEELMQDWTKLSFELDFKNKQISCQVNDTLLMDDLEGFNEKNGLRLMFGAHSYGNFSSTDVPSMSLRDVELLTNGQKKYRWLLNETEGKIAHSTPKGNNGIASNPTWVLKRHNTWENILSLDFPGEVKTAFDPNNNEVYILSKDSVYIFNVANKSLRSIPQADPASVDDANGLIYNTVTDILACYSLDNNFISFFDPETGQWSPHKSGTEEITAYWHHNHMISPDGAIVTLGGYGYFMYKNSLHKWNPESGSFDSLEYSGEFHPRYLAGSGFNPGDSLYYILGGYGSKSGKQAESPDYYYEILSYSPTDNAFSRVHEFQNTQAGFCFANSLVFDEDNNMYALSFDKYEFNNELQLIKILLDKPEIYELGDPIEYSFLDVDSDAELYYSKGSNSLLAVSAYTSENHTKLSVHSIAFPPQEFILPEVESDKSRLRILPFFLGGIILLISALVISHNRKRKSKKPVKARETVRETSSPKSKENSIILFGGFQVIDRNGKDITGQFTPLPKKLFLFILLHSLRNNKGVSSAVLYETFWFDKSVESARNNRAVNIVKLKSLLDNLDSANISKETGYWKFDFDPAQISIDYFEYLQIIGRTSELSREDIVALLAIIESSPFLNNTNADWLDTFKSEISNEIIDTIIRYMSNSVDDPEFMLHLTKCIFVFDAVSEEALKVQCRLLIKQGKHSLAKSSYSKFTKEYRQLYDEDYGLSFNQVIDEKHLPDGA